MLPVQHGGYLNCCPFLRVWAFNFNYIIVAQLEEGTEERETDVICTCVCRLRENPAVGKTPPAHFGFYSDFTLCRFGAVQ